MNISLCYQLSFGLPVSMNLPSKSNSGICQSSRPHVWENHVSVSHPGDEEKFTVVPHITQFEEREVSRLEHSEQPPQRFPEASRCLNIFVAVSEPPIRVFMSMATPFILTDAEHTTPYL